MRPNCSSTALATGAGPRGGGDGEAELVVADREGGNGCAVAVDEVVLVPGVGVGLVGEEGVVADDVAGDAADAACDELADEVVEILRVRAVGGGWG